MRDKVNDKSKLIYYKIWKSYLIDKSMVGGLIYPKQITPSINGMESLKYDNSRDPLQDIKLQANRDKQRYVALT